ncbi:MAG TPA: lysylphosphatidylglycerol synthase transmembrane domain-containing protein [bacterium]|nr:lysylphosphatidylglycerol synthase transmembrane domain-containing protein [bacterium]
MKRPIVRTLLKIFVVALVVGFLAFAIYKNANQLRELEFSLSILPLLASTLLVLVSFAVQAIGWHRILRGLTPQKIKLRESSAVWFASQAAKYVPGRMMLPLVRFSLCKRVGVDIGRTTMSIYLELTMMTSSAILVFILSSIGWADEHTWQFLAAKMGGALAPEQVKYAPLLLVALSLIGIHPRLLQWAINLGLRLLKKGPLTIGLSYARVLLLFGWYTLAWLIYALSCVLLIKALGDIGAAQVLPIVGAFMLSWVIGFLSFITPGGIGIREAVLTGLLTMWQFPLGIAMVAAVLCRLQWTGMELMGAALTIRYRPAPLQEIRRELDRETPQA